MVRSFFLLCFELIVSHVTVADGRVSEPHKLHGVTTHPFAVWRRKRYAKNQLNTLARTHVAGNEMPTEIKSNKFEHANYHFSSFASVFALICSQSHSPVHFVSLNFSVE